MKLQYGKWYCNTKNGQIEYITPFTVDIALNQYNQYLDFLALVKKLIDAENQLPICLETMHNFWKEWLRINNSFGTIVINDSTKTVVIVTNSAMYYFKLFMIESVVETWLENKDTVSLPDYINNAAQAMFIQRIEFFEK